MSDTGREQAVVAPTASARSSMRPQFSGPFHAATSRDDQLGFGQRGPASSAGSGGFEDVHFAFAEVSALKASTEAVPSEAAGMPMALGVVVMTNLSVEPVICALAFPLNTLRV